MSVPAPCFWTVASVAEMLHVKADVVLAWIHRGELIAVNVAERRRWRERRPRWRIADEDLQGFLRSRRSTPAPKIARQRRDNGDQLFFRGGQPVAQANGRPEMSRPSA
jgi:hypothetical protein